MLEKRPIPRTGELLPVIGCGTYRGFDVTAGSAADRRLSGVLQALFEVVARFCNVLLAAAEFVTDLPALDVVPNDPKDNMVVATAVATAADYLVTGDRRHLLPIGSYEGIQVVTPRHFLDLLHR